MTAEFVKRDDRLRAVHRAAAFAVAAAASVLVYVLCSRRVVDFSDEGFYYTSAWLAYSREGSTPVAALLMNFGKILGVPYLFTDEPPIIAFRLMSMCIWYGAHYWLYSAFGRAVSIRTPAYLLHLLCAAGLFIFLIPSLSYQNLPYVCAAIATAAALDAVAGARLSPVLAAVVPISLAAGIISSTPFAALAPIFFAVILICCRRAGRRLGLETAVGVVLGIALCALVFKPLGLQQIEAALSFFNSEVTYTDAGRIGTKFGELVLLSLPALALGIATFAVWRWPLSSSVSITEWVLFVSSAVMLAFLLRASDRSCVVTCDSSVIALIRVGLLCLAPLGIMLLQRGRQGAVVTALIALPVVCEMYFASVSNAPLQYNLKFMVPAEIGLLFVLAYHQWHKRKPWIAFTLMAAFAAAGLTAGRVLLFSHYGGSDIRAATLPLPGPKFVGLYGDPLRVALLERMRSSYRDLGCAGRFFAAVDSLALPYFLFERRPPFPHAWVAKRVAMSREIITRQPSGCVMMQDRVLPDTPAESRTMLGYLDLSEADPHTVVALGENIYLIAFTRDKSPARPQK